MKTRTNPLPHSGILLVRLPLPPSPSSFHPLTHHPHRNPWLEGTFLCSVIAQYDSITLSYGAHPTAFACPTAATYLASLSALLKTIPEVLATCERDPGRPEPRFVMLTQPAWRALGEYRRDCRTDQRCDVLSSLW